MPKTVITNATIAKAKADSRPGGGRYDVVDAKATGLSLRVSPSGVQWSWRFQINGHDKRLALGPVDLWSIAEARSIVDRGQELIRARLGIPDTDWLERLKVAKGKVADRTLKPEADAKPSQLFGWTFAQAREQFVDEKKRTKRPATWKDYESKLSAPELKKLDKKPVARITLQELATIIAGIHRSGRERTAELTAAVLSSMWSWLEQPENIRETGVERGAMRGLRAPERSRRPSRRRVEDPTLEDLGRVIAIARSGAVDPLIGCAVELLVWSVQRRSAVVAVKLEDLRPIGDGTEGLWYVFGDDRKRDDGEAHVVPLPPPAWAAVQRALKIVEADYLRRLDDDPNTAKPEYLFPATRPRARGMAVTHLHPSTLTHILGYMPGVSSNPHRVRAIFASYMEVMRGLSRASTKLILDHAEGGTRSDVTGRHYALHHGTHEKWPIMRTWSTDVEADVAKAFDALEPIEDLRAAIADARYGDDEPRQAAE